MKTSNYVPFVIRAELENMAGNILECENTAAMILVANRYLARWKRRLSMRKKQGKTNGAQWVSQLQKLIKILRDEERPYTVFAKGNSKLPFYSYSELPKLTCPGAGDCLQFCYSFTAWRYPQAFFRQLQNTIFASIEKNRLKTEFYKLPKNVILRLFVDGDFRDLGALQFWFELLRQRDDIQAYGYSKSWEVFLSYAALNRDWPTNYVLNVSSGSRYDNAMKREVLKLPIVRGEFIAVELRNQYKKGFARFNDKEYHNEIRELTRETQETQKVFSCPGQCGACLPNGQHACGLIQLKIPIGIGAH